VLRRTFLASGLGLAGALAGCAAPLAPDGRTDSPPAVETDSPPTPAVGTDSPPPPPGDAPLGSTHLRPDGNRLVDGRGSLPHTDPVDVEFEATPEWVVGVPWEDGVRLAVVTAGGARVLSVVDGEVSAVGRDLDAPPGPPLLVGASEPAFAPAIGSPLTHAVPTTGGWASVTPDGVVRLPGGENADVGALPDARIVRAAGRLYVLASRTREYAHGVLGDELEAASVAVLDPAGGVEATLAPPSGVVEGIAPIVADVDDDGEREVAVTASDAERGARLVALSAAGDAMVGPAIGSGFRWRHQLAVAPFGPGGETELAAVKTPHVGGTAEFYRARGGRLDLVASLDGYSTHAIGSRTLDTAVAGDLDGDGSVELLVPDDPRRALAGLRRLAGDEEGVVEAWRVPLGGRLTSNLCAVTGPAGVVVAAGRATALRVWPA
jgi:hypothetical protein